MGNGRDGKPPDRRGGQWHQSKVTGDSVQPRGKPGARPRTVQLERERMERAQQAARHTPATAPVPIPEKERTTAPDPDAKAALRNARARADASCDALFAAMVNRHAPADEAELGQHDEDAEEAGEPMQREEAPDTASAPVQRKEAPDAGAPVQRQEAPDSGELAQRQETPDASTPDPSSENEGLARIRELLAQRWVGPFNEAEIERIWGSFGPRVLDIAERNRALWDQCIERGAELDELPAVRAVQATFRADVQARAREVLRRNEATVRAELMALGITDDGVIYPAGSLIPEDTQADYLAELQERAGDLVAARRALAALRNVPVGFRVVAGKHMIRWVPATFEPTQPPPFGPSSRSVLEHARGGYQMRAWDEVMQHHQRLAQVIALLSGDSPALYATVASEDDDRLADMATGSPTAGRQAMAASLSELLANIRATIPKIGTDLDDRDLVPLHERLFAGEPGASGTNWSQPMHQWAARAMLAEHEQSEFWLTLGLGTLAAAAFVVAELATFGTATFFLAAGVGVGAGGALAGRGWEQWGDLDTAAGAGANDDRQIVTQGQADAAFTGAVIDSAFAFLDLIPAARIARVAATPRHGLPAAARTGAESVPAGSVDEAVPDARLSTRGADTTAAPGARHGAGAGMEPAGARTGEETALRLRPHEATNWGELKRKYIGKKLDEVGAPPGYGEVRGAGGSSLRRAVADDEHFAQLHVDGGGLIQPGAVPRVSNGFETAQSVDGILARNGLTQRPPHHQAHHVVPDEVVRKHPLMREAHRRGLFKPDAPENIALLAERQTNGMVPNKVPGLSEGLPRHQGAHPKYTEMVTQAANLVRDRLIRGAGALGDWCFSCGCGLPGARRRVRKDT
jgi:A nuclease family of the HNH/ENDO VII superfamily with conserved AHH